MSTAAGGSSSHSTLKKNIKYDVFISFRGEDTRGTITSHLLSALSKKKIKAFIDENDLRVGDKISPTLLKAIEESKLCVIILSENYASSRWCLEELAYILQCKKTDGQSEVLPLFYNVEPSNVRKQQRSYAAAFAELKGRFEDKKLQEWRDALRKVADLSGWTSKMFRLESVLVDTIVADVIKKLRDISVPRDDLKGLVGVIARIKEIESLLHIGSSNVGPVGIWGKGGIGKTTLARAVFNRLSSKFEACSFLENVREEWKKHGPNHLKNKLFSELMEGESFLTSTKNRLRQKRVLVVFDDVDDVDQFEQLVGDWFGPESRIIVTSRDQQVLRNIEVSKTYQVRGLNHYGALELFSLHAFKKKAPTENEKEFSHLSEWAVNVAGGIPLALIVLGRHLYSKSIQEWECTLEKLEKIPDKKILSVLKISYDSLDDNQQEIFLDIACFFKGEKRDFVQEILNGCNLFATEGIAVLIDKALITISEYSNMIEMHDLIQMMAFEIVSPRSTNQDPRKGGRLLTEDDIYHTLKNDRGIENVTGISLDTSNFNREISLTFSKMCKLRWLKITGTGKLYHHQDPPLFPDALRYLQWHGYPLKSLSTNFTAEMLVRLDMCGSQLEKLWEGSVHLNKLKSIDLTGSMQLTQLPDLSLAPNIESVQLMFCTSLIEVPSCFQHLNKLQGLDLSGCSSLCKLSGLPKNLITLEVLPVPVMHECGCGRECKCGRGRGRARARGRGCGCHNPWRLSREFSSKLERFPEISHPMECIETLTLDYSAIKKLPISFKNLTSLKKLSLRFCQNLEFLPDNFHCLSSLQELMLTCCPKLESLPKLPPFLSVLDAKHCTSLKMMSSSIDLVNQNWDYFFNNGYDWERLQLLGCDLLDENARKVLMDEARFRILRSATLYSNYEPEHEDVYDILSPENTHFCWPQSKIPWWFSHKSEESSISINLPHPVQWRNASYLGLAVCIVLEFENFNSMALETDFVDLHCDYVYKFPNGDSWTENQRWVFAPTPAFDRTPSFCDCCNTVSQDVDFHHHDHVSNCQHVYMFVDPTYGEFLASNNGKFDATGNISPHPADYDYSFLESGSYRGAYSKAGKKSGFNPTATASFSFNLQELDQSGIAKVKKCGVHLLCTQEAEEFGFVKPRWCNEGPELRGKEAIFCESDQEDESMFEQKSEDESIDSRSDQEEGQEPLPKRIRT